MEKVSDIDGAMFRYLYGDDQSETALLKAQLEHMGGALSREIEINAEARANIDRITAERDALKHDIERHLQIISDTLEENLRLREAIQPFAAVDVGVTGADDDEWFRYDGDVLTVGDFRRSRAALSPTQADGRGAAVVSNSCKPEGL